MTLAKFRRVAVQTKYTCLRLHLEKEEEGVPDNLALSHDSLYLLAKFLAVRGTHLAIALRIIRYVVGWDFPSFALAVFDSK